LTAVEVKVQGINSWALTLPYSQLDTKTTQKFWELFMELENNAEIIEELYLISAVDFELKENERTKVLGKQPLKLYVSKSKARTELVNLLIEYFTHSKLSLCLLFPGIEFTPPKISDFLDDYGVYGLYFKYYTKTEIARLSNSFVDIGFPYTIDPIKIED